LESLTREELIQLVKKKVVNENEAQNQLEAMKKEAESAEQQADEMTKELNNALLASQQAVEELKQKHLDDSANQVEVYEFLRIFFKKQVDILLGIFSTDRPIGAGEDGSSRRFGQKGGRNCGNAQGG
jgi:hypothetical protein